MDADDYLKKKVKNNNKIIMQTKKSHAHQVLLIICYIKYEAFLDRIVLESMSTFEIYSLMSEHLKRADY